jgi:hypothetical protein
MHSGQCENVVVNQLFLVLLLVIVSQSVVAAAVLAADPKAPHCHRGGGSYIEEKQFVI